VSSISETVPRAAPGVVTLPNALSAARLGTVPVFVWLFLDGREDAAVLVYGAGAFSDFLDGYIARRMHAVSDVGKLLDPLADRVLVVALTVALVGRGVMPVWLAGAIAVRDVGLLAAWPWLERRGAGRIPVSLMGKAGTAALLTGLTALAIGETSWTFAAARPGGLALVTAGAVAYWIAAAGYARRARTLLRRPRRS
jgi:cardiolipin synthase (CMP-forming)